MSQFISLYTRNSQSSEIRRLQFEKRQKSKKIVYKRKKSFAISENEHLTSSLRHLSIKNLFCSWSISQSAISANIFIVNDVTFWLQRIFVIRQSLSLNFLKNKQSSTYIDDIDIKCSSLTIKQLC